MQPFSDLRMIITTASRLYHDMIHMYSYHDSANLIYPVQIRTSKYRKMPEEGGHVHVIRIKCTGKSFSKKHTNLKILRR